MRPTPCRLLPVALRVLVLVVVLCTAATAARAASVLVDLEGGTGPCGFAGTTALRSVPSVPGVSFSAQAALEGGAVLSGCASFGVAPRSGDHFLAFNRGAEYADEGRARDPQVLSFDGGATRVSIWASGGHGATSFLMEAFDADGALLGSTASTAPAGDWSQLELAFPQIASVQLRETGGDNAFVFDDLRIEGLPEPGTGTLLLLALGVALRRGGAGASQPTPAAR